MTSKRSRAAFESRDGSDQLPPHAPFAIYGTPLPAYDAAERDDGSYVPVWKQEVTDERGRKRLHGAFTGGWSAGYFNTVGSKEGWTPSTFVSSRTNRAKDQKGSTTIREQRVEDYMDDEDLAEQEESQKLETQGAFAGLGAGDEGNGQSRGMFADLFRTTGDTMGIKLLQRMGWRPGQGIGAKVRRRAQGDKSGELHLFAPENTPMITFDRKTDHKGLGYAGEERLDSTPKLSNAEDAEEGSDRDARILQANRSKLLSKPKKVKKTGFGVGILNDNGSDDEDPFAIGPQINYNRIIGADRKKKKGLGQSTSSSTAIQATSTSKKLAQRAIALSGFRKCHDGRLPLEGFVLMSIPLTIMQENKYPPPEVPVDWTPAKVDHILDSSNQVYQSTADAAKASNLDPKSRAALLGEQQLPGKSVFDFMSTAARDKLATASGKSNLPPALGEGAPLGYEKTEAEKRRTLWDLIPEMDQQTAAAALQRGMTGWMPYAEDAEKRARYRYFLELRAGSQSGLPERPRAFSIDEWVKELREFTQAAEVFKPMSGLMATRFTSSSAAPKLASDSTDTPSLSTKEEDPAEKAAKLGMYGPMTRSRQPFFPTRLLCKRFNVRPPTNVSVDPGSVPDDAMAGSGPGSTGRLELVSQTNLDRMMREASFKPRGGFVSGGTEGGEAELTVLRPTVAEVDVEKNEALEGQKAGEAVFRAIFGSDDEDDE